MNGAKVVGLVLIVLGAIALLYSGFSYTTRDKVELGPVEITTQETKTIPIPPIAGGIALMGGVVLILTARGAGSRRAS